MIFKLYLKYEYCFLKKILILFISLFILSAKSYCIEEIELEKENLKLKTVSDIYYGQIDNSDQISPFIRIFSKDGLKFENSYINSVKIGMHYGGNLAYTHINNSHSSLVHDFQDLTPSVKVKFNENRSELGFKYNILRDLPSYSNSFTEKISSLYAVHSITENQKIIIGQYTRLPATYNGSLGTFQQDFVNKSQLGRTLGNARSVGLRNKAEYKYIDYDIGLYDSTRYMKDFGQGLDFTGHIMFKPFADIEDKTGTLKLGSGYNIGNYYTSYHLYSLFAQYDYKKFHLKTEYANADGYNGIVNSKNSAEGFYVTSSYDILPKLQLIGRYDYFVPNSASASSNISEYTIGMTYKPFKNMKLMLNYVLEDNPNSANSNMILFAARFFI